jgi:NAD(P)H-dependent FMN reductase
MSKPVLQIVVASTRPGRIGKSVADWLAARGTAHGKFSVEVVDLAEVDLPFFNEPKHPRLGEYVHDHTKAWSNTVARADAFAFVTPEYNFGFNAVLKNALDYLSAEWAFKAALVVSYGGVSAGTRAAQMLKQVLTALRLVCVGDVSIPFAAQSRGEDGAFVGNEMLEKSADMMFDELLHVVIHAADLRRP